MAPSLILKPGGRCSFPDRVAFVHTEPVVVGNGSRPQRWLHSFGVGCASLCTLKSGQLVDRYLVHFNQPWLWWQHLEEHLDRHKCTWVFSHNLGYHARLLGFFDWIRPHQFVADKSVLADPPTILTVRVGHKLVKMVDVLNYWRLSVCDLHSSLHPTAEVLVKSGDRQYTQPGSCQQVVEVIEQCLLALLGRLSETGCCGMRPTAASLSWAVYLKSFLPRPLSVSLDRRARLLERKSYFGGRVQAFACGSIKREVTALDNNSLYPSVMADHLYPCRLVSHPKGIRPGELKRMLGEYDAVAHVDLYPGEYPYPCRSASGVDFVRGVSTAVLAGDELRVACARCDVRKVYDLYLYERADLFSGFVKHFFYHKAAATAAGNRADVMLYKLMLNSLHGKFAQKGRRWVPAPHIMGGGYYHYGWHRSTGRAASVRVRTIAGQTEALEDGQDPRHVFTAISAAITANARVVLDRDMAIAGHQNVLYCDTDSLHVVRDGLSRLERVARLHQTKLGKYRQIMSVADAHYYGRQHYRLGDHLVCSALKPTAVQVAEGIYLQDAYMGVERGLETGILDSVPVADRVVDMSRRSSDAKRQIV